MTLDDSWEITDFRDEHLAGVLLICEAEGWPSLPSDPARALRALSAPGVKTVVATNTSGEVVGFAQVLSDGEIQGHLALLGVREDSRRHGVARSLLAHVFDESPDMRFDTLSSTEGESFYASLRHRRMSGFRLYPESMTDQDSNTTTSQRH
jgi:ribosomal protein S18 acetylase RimI-like enzyme